jgi:hypothetical protein
MRSRPAIAGGVSVLRKNASRETMKAPKIKGDELIEVQMRLMLKVAVNGEPGR